MVSTQQPETRLQGYALRLAAIPMLAGLSCLAVWLLTEWTALLWMGYGSLGLGVLAALFVPFLLLRSWSTAPDVRKTVLISLLAVANVPVMFAAAVQGLHRLTCLRVEILNNAADDWRSVQLVGAGILEEATSIGPNQREVRNAWATQDGRLELHYSDNGTPSRVIVTGYTTTNLGGDYTVTRDADGVVTVAER